MKVDLIIPTYNPGPEFMQLVKKMDAQSIRPEKIIITNTEQKYYDRMVFSTTFNTDYKNMDVRHISKREFDHGKTRNDSVARSDADYFLLMTQDAMPVDDKLIEKLYSAMKKDETIAVAFARQVARDDSTEAERFTRNYNYPKQSAIHSEADIDSLGIKAYFCSNVCALYRRDIFDELGGFLNHTIFNEDMFYAAKAINSGYKIAYVAEAEVIHSHNYTCKQQFSRYFDNGVSHAKHPEVFRGLNVTGEGTSLVKKTVSHLKGSGRFLEIPSFIMQSAFKYLGFRKGKHYKNLSKKAIMRYTMNPEYWVKDELKRDRSSIDSRQGYGRSKEELEMIAQFPGKKRED